MPDRYSAEVNAMLLLSLTSNGVASPGDGGRRIEVRGTGCVGRGLPFGPAT